MRASADKLLLHTSFLPSISWMVNLRQHHKFYRLQYRHRAIHPFIHPSIHLLVFLSVCLRFELSKKQFSEVFSQCTMVCYFFFVVIVVLFLFSRLNLKIINYNILSAVVTKIKLHTFWHRNYCNMTDWKRRTTLSQSETERGSEKIYDVKPVIRKYEHLPSYHI